MSKQPSPDDLAKAIAALKSINNFNNLPIHPWHVSIIEKAAKQVQELQHQIGVCSVCGFKAWSNEENKISHCLYCKLEQQSREKDELIEKFVQATKNQIRLESQKTIAEIYNVNATAHSKGYGKK